MKKFACVFIGANSGNKKAYAQATEALANELVKRNIGVVYGGAKIGLMGILANKMLELKGEVIGVMPAILRDKEIAHHRLTQLHYVDSMQERKKLLCELADSFITMPGGLGTLEELFEVWNSAKIGLHQKPIGLLNTDNYFDYLLRFIEKIEGSGFLKKYHKNLILISDNASDLLDKMAIR